MSESRIAIITGGAGDIGNAIAFKLARVNTYVFIVDINKDKLTKIKAVSQKLSQKFVTIESDVSDYQHALKNIDFIKENYGPPSVLVNCAGIHKDASIIKMSEEDFDLVINVNLKGSFNYIKAISPIFKEQKYGKIINITSINAIRGKHGQANYAASKAGIIGLTKTAAIELGKYNINVNAIAPGMILTSMTRSLPKEIIEKAIEESLLKRTGEPEDVAELVNFLASDSARHITGQVINVDGGQYL